MSAFSHVLIIGAGTFGATTALELARLGHQVTIVDRSADGHASGNAASNDLNKIIRSDYGVRTNACLHSRTNCTVISARNA